MTLDAPKINAQLKVRGLEMEKEGRKKERNEGGDPISSPMALPSFLPSDLSLEQGPVVNVIRLFSHN